MALALQMQANEVYNVFLIVNNEYLAHGEWGIFHLTP
jgi:hypothetical protein